MYLFFLKIPSENKKAHQTNQQISVVHPSFLLIRFLSFQNNSVDTIKQFPFLVHKIHRLMFSEMFSLNLSKTCLTG